jgi:hypothetical protein
MDLTEGAPPRFARPALSDYLAPLRVSTQDGRRAWMRLPPPEEVARVAGLVALGYKPWQCDQPAEYLDLTGQDNAAWILGLWLPGLWVDWQTGDCPGPNVAQTLAMANPKPRRCEQSGRDVLHLLIASYYTLVEIEGSEPLPYEVACCDGSTGVPDYQMPCRIWCHDPAAMFHDLGFDLHHADDAADPFGLVWNYNQLNDAYGLILSAGGDTLRGIVRSLALPYVARSAWRGRRSRSGITSLVKRSTRA